MAVGAISLEDIRSADWSLKLDAIGEVVEGIDDVKQCLGIIATTPQGTDPLRPTFGSNIWRYLDHPIDRALPAIVSELTTAIARWEPRVTLVSVTAQPINDGAGQSGAHIDVTLNWQLRLGNASAPLQSTTITVVGAA
ncbi:MAG: GPW/gp25 family protein [Candidatus Binatus sp.]|uniref:GPW/gp25 family protein n=1 Tax=Candidatus Binatus sp. TaxID=2811406 RepID=UPI0027199F1D|nr:GPW/gp25 family protein [Candidatus Binatus sp.]MDO8433505.1 GPW/gp25 family protein [Candidatus Binatus sp.]